ncbi:serine/threonine protein kinase [Paenibacillus sp. Marseille-Q4541]|uniref:serine/threonine protein kinase n=1 Tax=Paenibacillus sp. Marseille-Q4541 TaxID=2831522 RepID=UPI0020195B41|nr:serine/threonine protein kinase [Paenibacillus sp. Marseille-Q4541]
MNIYNNHRMELPDLQQIDTLLDQIEIHGSSDNELVKITGEVPGVNCIGMGTDAAVFTIDQLPEFAFKIYSPEAVDKKKTEKAVYDRLAGSPFFATCYGEGNRYIVLSMEKGPTLEDCLMEGIPVPEQVILDVKEARDYAESVGLNPRDIHLKNVLNQNGRGKVLDVSEYVKEGDDQRWDHLVWAYYHVYPRFRDVKVPQWVIETVKKWYQRRNKASMNLEDFSSRVIRLYDKLSRNKK